MNNESPPALAAYYKWTELFRRRSIYNMLCFSKDHHLSMSQMGALFYINNKDAPGVSEIGESLNISGAAASQLLERLVQQGLVARTESVHDRRAKLLKLTEEGQQLIQKANRSQRTWLNNVLNTLSAEEQEQVITTFTLLWEKAQTLEET